MTSSLLDPATDTAVAAPAEPTLRRPLDRLGGAMLFLGPALIVAGNATCPPQASDSSADYIASLARDPFLSATSATFYHYGWLAMALGLLAALGLVRGRRGRALSLIGGIGAVLGALQISGLLLSDWFLAGMGNQLDSGDAVAVFEGLGESLSFSIWLTSAKIGVIALPVLFYAGLARAGVISWWLVPLAATPMLLGPMVGGMVPGVAGIALSHLITLIGFLPTFVTGLRVLGRSRLPR